MSKTGYFPTNCLISPTSVTVWLSGGTDRRKYKVTVQASTVGGRIDESEFLVIVKEF
jgi:hypothetical protein